MANYFNSNKITVYPTAYRQYVDENDDTIQVNPEARFSTEYNTTNLVNGLLDKSINGGNFVVDYDSANSIIKFCMQGYYFTLDLSGLNLTNLYVKVNIVNTLPNNADWKNMYELVPVTYDSEHTDRDLDTSTQFIGLEYVTTATDGYFPLLVSGYVPENSKLKFSIKDIGCYKDGEWYPISQVFEGDIMYTNEIYVDDKIETTKINRLYLTHLNDGFSIEASSNHTTLEVTANLTNSGLFSNSASFTNSNTFSNSASFTNSASFENTAQTSIKKPFIVGATTTYTGSVEIKSKNNLSIQGDTTANSNVIFKGSSTFQSGDYESVTTSGSESVKVGGNNFNIVTRDTQQTISGQKTFSSDVIISSATNPTSSTSGALKVAGGINTCLNNGEYLLALGNFGPTQYGLKSTSSNGRPMLVEFDRSTNTLDLHNDGARLRLYSTKTDATNVSNGTLRIDGSISSKHRCFFKGLSLDDDTLVLGGVDPHELSLRSSLRTKSYDSTPAKHIHLMTKANKHFTLTGSGDVLFRGSCRFDKGEYYSSNGADNEFIVIAGNRFNILTKDTTQTISGKKTLTNTIDLGTSGNYYIDSSGYAAFSTLYVKDGSNTKFLVDSYGNVFANQFYGNYYTSSDKRLKENIKPFENKKSILDLPIYTFDYINGKKNNIGCIAQDLQELYPELVEKDKDDYLTINENKLIYLLIDEVKKLKNIVENQQKEINKLL